MHILSIDYGEKNIGLAIGNKKFHAIDILKPIRNSSDSGIPEILHVIEKWRVSQIILGNPLSKLEIEERQKISKKIEVFYENLTKNVSLEIVLVDEFASTKHATQGLPPKVKRTLGDSFAAKEILERWLNLCEN